MKSEISQKLRTKADGIFQECGIPKEAQILFLIKGHNHHVFVYQVGQEAPRILKVLRRRFTNFVHSSEQEERNIATVTKAFDGYALPATVIGKGKRYYVEMEQVDGIPLHADSINPTSQAYNPTLRDQLLDIIQKDKQLLRKPSGQFLDLTGSHALSDLLRRKEKRSKRLDNIFVTRDLKTGEEKLKIVDHDIAALNEGNVFERLKSRMVFFLNDKTMRRDFGLDIRKNHPTEIARRSKQIPQSAVA